MEKDISNDNINVKDRLVKMIKNRILNKEISVEDLLTYSPDLLNTVFRELINKDRISINILRDKLSSKVTSLASHIFHAILINYANIYDKYTMSKPLINIVEFNKIEPFDNNDINNQYIKLFRKLHKQGKLFSKDNQNTNMIIRKFLFMFKIYTYQGRMYYIPDDIYIKVMKYTNTFMTLNKHMNYLIDITNYKN